MAEMYGKQICKRRELFLKHLSTIKKGLEKNSRKRSKANERISIGRKTLTSWLGPEIQLVLDLLKHH
jgi:hypothetical protein